MAHILIVDDEAHVRRLLSSVLRDEGHEVSEAANVAEARAALAGASTTSSSPTRRCPTATASCCWS
jgi:DNA-binding NtrC family response regulator